MNLFDAGLDILYVLMKSDRHIDDSEINEIMKYLLRCGFEMADNRLEVSKPEMEKMIMEMGLLGALSDEKLRDRFEKSADYFAKNTSEHQREKMIDFALKMIAADGVIVESEKTHFRILGERWGMNVENIIDGKIEELKKSDKRS